MNGAVPPNQLLKSSSHVNLQTKIYCFNVYKFTFCRNNHSKV